MKKTISVLLILIVCINICACTSAREQYQSVMPEEAEIIDFSNSVTIVSSPTPVPTTAGSATVNITVQDTTATPVPTSTVASSPAVTIVSTPTPTIVIVNTSGNPITKSPYSDTVNVGGTVKFVATASNYSSLSWIIKSHDSTVITMASNAPSVYPGLIVSGTNSTVLTLSNVPVSMDGCLIQCVFSWNGYDYYTDNAILTVLGQPTTDDAVRIMANSCHDQFAVSASSLNYTTSSILNYYVMNNVASFNIDFNNGSYLVRGEFKADSSSFQPTHAYVYDSTGKNFIRDYPLSLYNDLINVLINPTGI